MKPQFRKRAWEVGANAALLLVLAAVLGGYLYRQQLNRQLARELGGNQGRSYEATLAVIRRLIRQGAEVNTHAADGNTALHWLAGSGHPKWVLELLERGAKVNLGTRDGSTHLMSAVTEDLETIRLLLQHGADVNARDAAGKTPLHWAAASGRRDPRVLRLLLEHGADATARDRYGETAVYIAAIMGSGPCIETLLDAGGDPNAGNPLAQAAIRNRVSAVRVLLQHGAVVEARDGFGQSALSEAAENGYEDVVRCLVEHGANPNTPDRDGHTILFWLQNTVGESPERKQRRLRIIAYLKQHRAHL